MNKELIIQGMEALSLLDQDIQKAYKEIGPPPERIAPHGFETFLSTIISQQISIKAAASIIKRVVSLMPSVTPQNLMAQTDQALRDAGLSWQKVEYAKGLAEAVINESFDIEGLEYLDDEEAIKSITNLRGFGQWSAEIYLMFSLQRKDIFPADDLGLLVALGQLKGLSDKPTPKQAREIVTNWSPWRSVGALFLWHYYHH